MAAIIQDDRQVLALKEIEESIDIMKNLKIALEEGVSFTITAAPASGKAVKIEISDSRDSAKVQSLLNGYKGRLGKEIMSKAQANRIALSDKELQTIRGTAKEGAV